MEASAAIEEDAAEATSIIIDCDVHQDWREEDEIAQYLPSHFRERGMTPPGGRGWTSPLGEHGFLRDDAAPEDGPPGSSYELMEEQLFGDFGIDYGVLTGSGTNYALMVHPNVHYAKAAIEAYNDWQIAEWLDRDERFLGSINVVPHAPAHAVAEIERLADHPQMVQVLTPGAHAEPYGRERYWPIYAAAEEAGLPVALHGGTTGSGVSWAPRTGAGIAGSYFEKHITASAVQMGQLTSIILDGVFAEHPDLEWVFIEQRLGWIPHIMWHMDKCWKGLKETVPWLERRPSRYIRDHVSFTTQPIEEPEQPEHLRHLFDMLHADETLLFSSDYPHWDNDNPKLLFGDLEPATRRRILSENARELYGL